MVILNMNVLHGKFPNFCDLSKEGNENSDMSGDQNAYFIIILVSSQLLGCIHKNVRGLSAQSFTFSVDGLYGDALGQIVRFSYFGSVFQLFFFISMQCFGCMETGSLICSLNH